MAKALRSTRERLLMAAAEAFSKQGFRGTTVRMICAKAQANVAAVSYYFGSKEKLYIETYDYVFSKMDVFSQFQPHGDIHTEDQWRDAVYRWAYGVLKLITGNEKWQTWRSRLFARERTEPSAVLPVILERVFRPIQKRLDELLLMALPPSASESELMIWRVSTISQCTVYAQREPPWDHELFPDTVEHERWLTRVAGHVTASVTERLTFGDGGVDAETSECNWA